MKKRQDVFGIMAIRWIWGLFFAAVLEAIWIIIEFYRRDVIGRYGLIGALIGTISFAAVLVAIIHRTLLSPYRDNRILFYKFVNGEAYHELLDSTYQIFEEQKAVLQKFHHLLDKQNIIELSTKQAELLALQNQINPHFLYNTLEAIRGDALCEGMESIADTTEALSTFFRYTIADTGNLVALEDELENVDNYFKIQQYRFGEKLKKEVCLPEDADVSRWKLPKLTLQPIVENSIFHGLESNAVEGRITIQIETTKQKLLISVRDNGIGIPPDKLERINHKLEYISSDYGIERSEKSGGIAMSNVCRRIKLLFGEEYGIHVYSVMGIGTDVRISIPLIENEGNIHNERRTSGN